MGSEYKVIDIEQWERKEHFRFYQTFNHPFYNIIANVDITDAVHQAKAADIPVFLTYYHAAIKAVNDIPELKIRMVDGELREYETIDISSTFLNDDNTFSFCLYPFYPELKDFVEAGLEVIHQMKTNKVAIAFDPTPNLIYATIVPWVQFTGIQHPYKHSAEDLIPRLSFGKFFKESGRVLIPFSAHIHHGVADGIHAGKLFREFEENCKR